MRLLVSIAGVSRRKKQYRQPPVSEFLHLPVPYRSQAQAAVVPLVPAFPERRKLPARAAGVDLLVKLVFPFRKCVVEQSRQRRRI